MPSWSYQQQCGNFPPTRGVDEKSGPSAKKGMLCFYKFDILFVCVALERECILDFILDAYELTKQSEMQETPTF